MVRVERSRWDVDKVCDTTASGNTCTCAKQQEPHANVIVKLCNCFVPLQSTVPTTTCSCVVYPLTRQLTPNKIRCRL